MSKTEKSSFVLYTNWARLMYCLPTEQAGLLIQAICAYQLGEGVNIEDPAVEAMYSMILPKMKDDAERYEKTKERRSKAAKAKYEKQMYPNASKCIQKDLKPQQMDSDTDTDTVTDTDTDTDTDTVTVYPTDTNSLKTTSNEVVSSTDIQAIVDEWNALPEPIPRVSKISRGSKREQMLKARIREYGVSEVLRAIGNIKRSDFLLGKNKRGWNIVFDWFIKPSNFTKVLEGNYSDKESQPGTFDANQYLMDMIQKGDAV